MAPHLFRILIVKESRPLWSESPGMELLNIVIGKVNKKVLKSATLLMAAVYHVIGKLRDIDYPPKQNGSMLPAVEAEKIENGVVLMLKIDSLIIVFMLTIVTE